MTIRENIQPYTGDTQRLDRPQVGINPLVRTAGIFCGGWGASLLYSTIQNTSSYGVLMVLCVLIPVVLVWRGNHKIADTWPSDWP